MLTVPEAELPTFFLRIAAKRTCFPVDVYNVDKIERPASGLFFLMEATDDIAAGLFVGFEVH
jgi:hypothetical protein